MKLRNYIRNIIAAIILVGAVGGCSSVPLTGRSRVNLVSDDVILTSSFQQYRDFMSKASISSDARQTQRVRTIGSKIAQATDAYLRTVGLESEAKLFQWEFNLVRSDEVNAFCMPGGKIVVYEGLLKYASTDDELATVMAHEVAHAVAKHANERMSQELMRQYGGNILGIALGGKSPAVQQIAGVVYGIGSQVAVMLPYSRTHEYEADRIGLYLMAIAGYNPESAVSFWQKMSAGKGSGANDSDMFSTHPSDSKRISAIRAELPKVNTFMYGDKQTTPPQPKLTKEIQKQNDALGNANRKVPIETRY